MLRSVRYSCRQLWRRDGEGEVRDNRDSSDAGCEMRDARCGIRNACFESRIPNRGSRIAQRSEGLCMGDGMNGAQTRPDAGFGGFQIVVGLEVEPVLWRLVKCPSKQ